MGQQELREPAGAFANPELPPQVPGAVPGRRPHILMNSTSLYGNSTGPGGAGAGSGSGAGRAHAENRRKSPSCGPSCGPSFGCIRARTRPRADKERRANPRGGEDRDRDEGDLSRGHSVSRHFLFWFCFWLIRAVGECCLCKSPRKYLGGCFPSRANDR